MKVKFFDDGVEKFIASLEAQTVARVLRTIDLLEMFGNRLGPPHTKKIEPGLFELRVRGRQEVRLFYAFQKGEIIVLSGFVKKTERIPWKELETVRYRLRSLDAR